MKVPGIGLGLLILLAANTCAAQSSQDNSSNPTNGAKPAATASDSSNNTGEKKKPKKVWTNEEIGSVHGTVSVVGDAKSSPVGQDREKKAEEETAKSANDEARNKQIENYRGQIQDLQLQIEHIDERVAQLKSFRAENTNPSAGIHLNHGYNMDPIEDQLKQLDAQKKQLQSKIGDIEVEARKNGIDPGDLR
jgi:DNA repair exonuclease SbcCD ATPase subunit